MDASESREHGVVLLFRINEWIRAPVDASCLIRLQGSIFKVCSKPFLSATWFSARQTEEQRGYSYYFCYFLYDYIFFSIFFSFGVFNTPTFKKSSWVALTFRKRKRKKKKYVRDRSPRNAWESFIVMRLIVALCTSNLVNN